ncbi:MAG: hypothetical protein PHT12_02685 [Patescibacteria group bacterium]|nr:hypothetical protein [Patescibacteria group bacterium]
MNFAEKPEAQPAAAPPETQAEQLASPESGPRPEGTPAQERKQPVPVAPMPQIVLPDVAPSAAAPAKDPQLMRVERVLEDGLLEAYLAMPAKERARFRAVGEETAAKINVLIEQSKATAKAVLKLIRDWLRMIPGVNRFFLEQEAKLKTDRVMLLNEQRRRDKEGGTV